MYFAQLIAFLTLAVLSYALEDYELDLFDLVEEVNGTFYEFMGVEQDSTTSEIRKAYRKLSLVLHPDKNKQDDAELQFRQLAAIYEVLKSPPKRERYNDILVNGLPDWRQPIYYYRKVRKFGFAESSVVLLLIATIIHYAMIWAAYWERCYVIEEMFQSRKKKDSKRRNHQQRNDAMDTQMDNKLSALQRPTLYQLIPCLVIWAFIRLMINTPSYMQATAAFVKERIQPPVEEKSDDNDDELVQRRKQPIDTVFSDMPEAEMASTISPVSYTPVLDDLSQQSENSITQQELLQSKSKKVVWKDEDDSALARAMVKFPVGTPLRWEKIAQHIGHRPADVVTRAKEMKSGNFTSTQQTAVVKNKKNISVEVKGDISVKYDVALPPTEVNDVSGDDSTTTSTEWSQEQQKCLEKALTSVPKAAADRWTVISNLVPGKSKVECMTRYKHLAELVKRKKKETE